MKIVEEKLTLTLSIVDRSLGGCSMMRGRVRSDDEAAMSSMRDKLDRPHRSI
jgi:hypothetical protein